jgi:ankyrin repeat protein
MARYKIKSLTYRTLLFEKEFSFGGQRETLIDPLWLLQEQLRYKLPEEAVKATLRCIKERNIDVNRNLDEYGTGVLHVAIGHYCDIKIIALLLDAGADKDKQNLNLRTPLNYAITTGDPGIVRLLIDNGVKIDTPGWLGLTPLCEATMSKKTEIVQLLIDSGAEINRRDEHGQTALHWAISGGFLSAEIVRLLIENKADANIANDGGWTALHWAIRLGGLLSVEIVRLLITEKNINVKDKNGDTPLDTVISFRQAMMETVTSFQDLEREKIMHLLIEHGAKRGYELPEESS